MAFPPESALGFLPEDKETRLRCYREVLLQNWNVDGYILFKPICEDWLRNELPQYTQRDINRKLYEHVRDGGSIDERTEQRSGSEADYTPFRYWYRIRLQLDHRRIFFETILAVKDENDPDRSTIFVVSIHDD